MQINYIIYHYACMTVLIDNIQSNKNYIQQIIKSKKITKNLILKKFYWV